MVILDGENEKFRLDSTSPKNICNLGYVSHYRKVILVYYVSDY